MNKKSLIITILISFFTIFLFNSSPALASGGFMLKNAIFNGNFEIAPPFTASTTANDVVVNGTAAGGNAGTLGVSVSAEKSKYKWKVNIYTTTNGNVSYDSYDKYSGNYSMRLAGSAIKERVNLTYGRRQYPDLSNEFDITQQLVPVFPSKQYTISASVKQTITNESGTAGIYGSLIGIFEHSPIAYITTNYLNNGNAANQSWATTMDWTNKSLTFTTNANTRYLNITPYIAGNATNYADISTWFDDIDLETITTSRTKSLLFSRLK